MRSLAFSGADTLLCGDDGNNLKVFDLRHVSRPLRKIRNTAFAHENAQCAVSVQQSGACWPGGGGAIFTAAVRCAPPPAVSLRVLLWSFSARYRFTSRLWLGGARGQRQRLRRRRRRRCAANETSQPSFSSQFSDRFPNVRRRSGADVPVGQAGRLRSRLHASSVSKTFTTIYM